MMTPRPPNVIDQDESRFGPFLGRLRGAGTGADQHSSQRQTEGRELTEHLGYGTHNWAGSAAAYADWSAR
jgi:hypothetical protein